MLRYMPPKSSIWGHSMRRKLPQEFRNCVATFLDEAVHKRTTQSCSVWTTRDDLVDSLRAETQISANRDQLRSLHKISEAEFETCLDWVIEHRNKIPAFDGPGFIDLRRQYLMSWKCAADEQPPMTSQLGEIYGTKQLLGTHLQFRNVSEYRQIKAIVERIFGFEMNDKHVRPKGVMG